MQTHLRRISYTQSIYLFDFSSFWYKFSSKKKTQIWFSDIRNCFSLVKGIFKTKIFSDILSLQYSSFYSGKFDPFWLCFRHIRFTLPTQTFLALMIMEYSPNYLEKLSKVVLIIPLGHVFCNIKIYWKL